MRAQTSNSNTQDCNAHMQHTSSILSDGLKKSINAETQQVQHGTVSCFQGGGLIPRRAGTTPKTGAACLFPQQNIPVPL